MSNEICGKCWLETGDPFNCTCPDEPTEQLKKIGILTGQRPLNNDQRQELWMRKLELHEISVKKYEPKLIPHDEFIPYGLLEHLPEERAA